MSTSDIAFLGDLETIIRNRIENPPAQSYTVELINSGSKRIAQKIGEEGVELALAAAVGDKNEVIDEAADLLFHVLVLIADQRLGLKDVCDRLQVRHSDG